MNQLDLLTTLNYTHIAMANNNTPASSRVSGIIPTKVLLDEFGLDDISSRKRIYIVAGTYDQFEHYVQTKLSTHDNLSEWPRYIYVHSAYVLRGLSNPEGFFVGTWRERKDISEIKLAIKIIKRG
jgi:hypothetical protein